MADSKSRAAIIVGAASLVAFGVFTTYLVRHVEIEELKWGRLVYLFGGVEAVAYGAAGFFFGKEVNRVRAEKAEEKEAKAQENAMNSHGAKRAAEERLASLATFIDEKRKRMKVPLTNALHKHLAMEPGIETKLGTDPDWDELAEVANTLVGRNHR